MSAQVKMNRDIFVPLDINGGGSGANPDPPGGLNDSTSLFWPPSLGTTPAKSDAINMGKNEQQ